MLGSVTVSLMPVLWFFACQPWLLWGLDFIGLGLLGFIEYFFPWIV